MSPLFSIIIPCFNQSIYLQDCFNSIQTQAFQDWEAILINDGSTDNTTEVANRFASKDGRIKVIEKLNGGLSSARNTGIKAACGNRFIFLDADDYLYPDCLQQIANHLKSVDDNTVVQYGYTYVSEDGQKKLHTVLPLLHKNLLPSLFSSVLGPCHTICISKKQIDAIGYFDETLKSLEDWDYWLRIAKTGASHSIISHPLVYYRYVRNSMSRNAKVMYESFKTVALRAPLKDSRINIDSAVNLNYNFETSLVLQEALIRMLGVNLMQGKIEDSVQFFKDNTSKNISAYTPNQFEMMCSYLSFRYWYTREDIKNVIDNLVPNFNNFFQKLGYDELFINQALYHIFKRHYFYLNNYKYGKIIGGLKNYLLRKKYQL
jgi:glycosyltransferase involved in cell wall biosynthesis